eukprot:GSMAST32.ASY1.ANO1.1090.1 assembled CDS
MRFMPLVFAGPSGVGKGTLSKLLFKRFPEQFGLSVSHTTREPRVGEIDGEHYHFVDRKEMNRAILAGKFIENAEVHTNLYGTSIDAIRTVSEVGLNTRGIFVLPPSIKTLKNRLRGRNSETNETLAIRLAVAEKEMKYGRQIGNFDAVIVNDELNVAFEKVVENVLKWYPHLKKNS